MLEIQIKSENAGNIQQGRQKLWKTKPNQHFMSKTLCQNYFGYLDHTIAIVPVALDANLHFIW